MKTICTNFWLTLLLLSSTYSAHAQNGEIQPSIMLKNFYMAHHEVWNKEYTPKILVGELDSLYKIYCTDKLRIELKKLLQEQGLDHDIFTNDYGTDEESMRTLDVVKGPSQANHYIVSYNVNTEDPRNKKIKIKVVIHLIVEKEANIFKIADIK